MEDSYLEKLAILGCCCLLESSDQTDASLRQYRSFYTAEWTTLYELTIR